MQQSDTKIDHRDWPLLVLLAVLWGASFLFVGILVKELPPLTIVLARVLLAAFMLLPVLYLNDARLPKTPQEWLPFFSMGLLNNVIPFTLIATGQAYITSGLASVLNATTPLFTVVIMAIFREEPLTANRLLGLVLGVLGVLVLRGGIGGTEGQSLFGTLLCLGAAVSYGFAGLWGRRRLADAKPVSSATCQLVASSFVMLMLASIIEQPWKLPAPSAATWLLLLGFAALTTALAYIVFFQVLVRSGATNVMLVTLLIPVAAIAFGHMFLAETVTLQELLGATMIGSALLVVDGRVFTLLGRKASSANP